MNETHINLSSIRSLFVEPYFCDTRLSSATAFVVSAGEAGGLVTNRHVVTGRDQATGQPLAAHGGVPDRLIVWHNAVNEASASESALSWIAVNVPLYENDVPRWVEHPDLGPRADVVILPIEPVSRLRLYPYDLNLKAEMLCRPADPMSVVGFPFGRASAARFAIWATGFVASEPDIPFDDLPVVLIDCRTRQGQSGSPVIMQRNVVYGGLNGELMAPYGRGGKTQFVGVYSGRINTESDIGMVWTATAIRQILEQ